MFSIFEYKTRGIKENEENWGKKRKTKTPEREKNNRKKGEKRNEKKKIPRFFLLLLFFYLCKISYLDLELRHLGIYKLGAVKGNLEVEVP
jgi:hypothetical protein